MSASGRRASPDEQRSRRLRADAERNRRALLDTARGLYASHGVDVSLEEIARRAGVGIGTLYRHFPRGKQQLVAEALVDEARLYLDAARRALAVGDPWAGFVSFVEEICAMQADRLGLSDLLAMTLAAGESVEEIRRQANEAAVELIDRAKGAGRLRPDFVGEDLILLLVSNAAVVHLTRADAPNASRRLLALQLEALSTGRNPGALPEPPTAEAMRRALARAAANRGCGPGAGEDGPAPPPTTLQRRPASSERGGTEVAR